MFIVLVTLALPHAKDVHEVQLLGLVGLLSVLALVLWRFGAELDGRQISTAVALTTVVIALLNFAAGTTAGFGLLFAMPVIYAFYFLDIRFAA